MFTHAAARAKCFAVCFARRRVVEPARLHFARAARALAGGVLSEYPAARARASYWFDKTSVVALSAAQQTINLTRSECENVPQRVRRIVIIVSRCDLAGLRAPLSYTHWTARDLLLARDAGFRARRPCRPRRVSSRNVWLRAAVFNPGCLCLAL